MEALPVRKGDSPLDALETRDQSMAAGVDMSGGAARLQRGDMRKGERQRAHDGEEPVRRVRENSVVGKTGDEGFGTVADERIGDARQERDADGAPGGDRDGVVPEARWAVRRHRKREGAVRRGDLGPVVGVGEDALAPGEFQRSAGGIRRRQNAAENLVVPVGRSVVAVGAVRIHAADTGDARTERVGTEVVVDGVDRSVRRHVFAQGTVFVQQPARRDM